MANIYLFFASLILAVGAVYYFHTKTLWLLLVGTALLFLWGFYVVQRRGR